MNMAEVPLAVNVDEYKALVGQALPQSPQYRYAVSEDTIRQFANAIDDFNAIYVDTSFARTTRHGSIFAPPGYLYGHGMATWLRMLPGIKDSSGEEMSATDNAMETWDFFEPVRPGDSIHSYATITNVEAKRGRRIAELALVESETRYINQRGELVATNKAKSFRFNGARVGESGGLAKTFPPLDPGCRTRDIAEPVRFPGSFDLPARRYNARRSAATIVAGDLIDTWRIGPLSTAMLGRFNAETIGGAWELIGESQSGSIPDAFAPGLMQIPWFGSMLMTWAGPDAWVRRLSQKNQEWVLVGYAYDCAGRVTDVTIGDRSVAVTCELWCDCELGFRTNVGNAVVEFAL